MLQSRSALVTLFLLPLGFTAACGDSSTGPTPVATVTVTPNAVTLQVGDEFELDAVLRDPAGNALLEREVAWGSSDQTVATVSSQGNVSAVAPGSTTVSAISEGRSGFAQITVVPVPVAAVVVAPDDVTLQVGHSFPFSATAHSAEGTPLTDREMTWVSSAQEVATVSAEGLVSAITPGSAAIYAMAEGSTGTGQVTVVAVPVADVAVTPDTATIEVGDTRHLVAIPRGEDGGVLTAREVVWSSSAPDVAIVSHQGLVSAVEQGVATITASVGGQSGFSQVTVVPCSSEAGDENSLDYSWSLVTQRVTLTNRNRCDPLFIWATSTPLCNGCENTIVDAFVEIAPGETIDIGAGVPLSPTWRPVVLYSTANERSFVYHPSALSALPPTHQELLLLDFSERHQGTLPDFTTMFSIGPGEEQRGECQDFRWVRRNAGEFAVEPSSTGSHAFCFVGNIDGVTSSGHAHALPPLFYFVTDRSARER